MQGGERALVAEVIEFDEFVEAHGACGGWHPDDHAQFLRILTSCRGDYSHAILIATDQLPGVSKDMIIGHARQVIHFAYIPLFSNQVLRSLVACRTYHFVSPRARCSGLLGPCFVEASTVVRGLPMEQMYGQFMQ